MTICSVSAKRKYRERSSFTSESGTVFIRSTFLLKPGVGIGFRDDRQHLDFFANDVIEHTQLIHAKAILRVRELPKTFDPTLAHLGRLVSQVDLHSIAHLSAIACAQAT